MLCLFEHNIAIMLRDVDAKFAMLHTFFKQYIAMLLKLFEHTTDIMLCLFEHTIAMIRGCVQQVMPMLFS